MRALARPGAVLLAVAAVVALPSCTSAAAPRPSASGPPDGSWARATVADAPAARTDSDGDLWPSCWADDGSLYAANGDGAAFGGTFFDTAVSRIDGDDPEHLTGTTLAGGDAVGQVWSGADFTRKPTGLLCVGGRLYLAVQDLRKDFNTAPAATIAVSDDHGRTWSWDRDEPMFRDAFTTIFFADFGRDSADAPDGFVYAYGLDGNWRDSFDDSVPDPQDLFLARVPADAVQDRSAWRFYAGERDGSPRWVADIGEKRAVLHDGTRRYPGGDAGEAGQTVGASDLSTISQGGVLYDAPLRRYLYTSWTELTYEFFESPTPWGPWQRLLTKDWGRYPWTDERHGGYGTTIPSKFVSADGRSMWLQSNVCPCADAGMAAYDFDLRRMELDVR